MFRHQGNTWNNYWTYEPFLLITPWWWHLSAETCRSLHLMWSVFCDLFCCVLISASFCSFFKNISLPSLWNNCSNSLLCVQSNLCWNNPAWEDGLLHIFSHASMCLLVIPTLQVSVSSTSATYCTTHQNLWSFAA
jgi:hypothetical protein